MGLVYVGAIVHQHWRGRCHAAIITDFWEDQDTVALSLFEAGGVTSGRRIERGQPGEDARWHTLGECPNVPKPAPVEVAQPETAEESKAKSKA